MAENKILILVDSTTDIPKEYREKYGIVEEIPLFVNLGENYILDDDDFNNEMILDYVAKSGGLPATAAITPTAFEEIFAKYKDNTLIYMGVGSQYSSCYQNSLIAADEFPNAKPFDTKSFSCGGGYLAIYASKLAKEGRSVDEIFSLCEEKMKKLDVSFVVNTLKYLHKGGRCSAATALGANLLNIKPCIKVDREDGLKVVRKYRGNTDKIFAQYTRDALGDIDTIDDSLIFVVHTMPKSSPVPQEFARLVQQIYPFKECVLTEAGSSIFTHAGPNAIGLMFARK